VINLISEELNTLNAALGEMHPSPKIINAIKVIGTGFVETASIIKGNFYFEFFTAGVSFNFECEQLVQISLYMKPIGLYKVFSGQIFDGVKSNEIDIHIVQSVCGHALSTGGGESSLVGYINRWTKYNIDRLCMNFEFGNDDMLSALHLLYCPD
jgi:filamentous hemagglutinin